jgi:AraC-like DNA-binding protein
MSYSYEELAQEFVRVPLEVHGVYWTELKAEIVGGHLDRPTSKCAIVVALKGQADFIFDETEKYRLEPGIVLLGGLRKRLEIRTGSEGFEYCLVHYLPMDIDSADARRLTEVSAVYAAMEPELRQLLDRLLQAASSPDSMGLLEKKSLFYQLLSQVLKADRHERNKTSHSMIDEAIEYIQSHYAQSLTLDHLAERYRLKAKYFSYLFHKYMGIGPIDYLIQYRMNRAHDLLMTGQFSVSAVAKSVGYPDAYYFSRLFKKHKGVPPGKVGF